MFYIDDNAKELWKNLKVDETASFNNAKAGNEEKSVLPDRDSSHSMYNRMPQAKESPNRRTWIRKRSRLIAVKKSWRLEEKAPVMKNEPQETKRGM